MTNASEVLVRSVGISATTKATNHVNLYCVESMHNGVVIIQLVFNHAR